MKNYDYLNKSTEYTISSVKIESTTNKNFYDLIFLYDSIRIHESIFEPFIYGSISVIDSNGIIEALPIVGEEIISFRIKKLPSDNKWFEVIGSVYSITDRTRDPKKKEVEEYTINFISHNALTNQNIRISKTYDCAISKSVEEISKNLQLKKIESVSENLDENPKLYENIYIEPSTQKTKINIPNLRPVEAINFLSRFVYSQTGGSDKPDQDPFGTTYMFYQTRQGFFYQSIENNIKNKKGKIKHAFTIMNDPNVKTEPLLVEKSELFTIMDYRFLNIYDNFESSGNGYYGGTNIGYDTLTKSVHEYKFNYSDKFDNMVHIDNNNTNNEDFIYCKNSEKSYIKTLPTKKGCTQSKYISEKDESKDIFYMNEDKIDIIRHIKKRRFDDGLAVEITIPSNIYLNVNDIVKLNFPSFERKDNHKEFNNDKYFSGNYLVVGIEHILSNIEDSDWIMKVTLMKDSFKSKVEKKKNK